MLSGMPNRSRSSGVTVVIAHHQRLLDQRFDAAQARADARNLHRVDDVGRLAPIGVFDQERDQAAEAAHRAPGDVVVRMRGQARVIHAFDARMGRQELGDRLAVLVVPLHAQFEGLEAALQQVDVVRRVDRRP